jgi:hypothetical protein
VAEIVSPSYASSSSTSIARGARPRSSPVGLLVAVHDGRIDRKDALWNQFPLSLLERS